MASLSQTINPLGALALLFASGLRVEAAVYQIDEPRIGAAESVSSGGDFLVVGSLRSEAPNPLSNDSFELTGTFSSLICNHAPFASSDVFFRAASDDLKIDLKQVLANDFDPDADPLTVEVSTVSTAGALIAKLGSWIFYRHMTASADSFNYTVTDSFGASSQGRVDILIGNPDDQFSTHLRIASDGAGVHIAFNAIPNRTYLIQSRDTLDSSWVDRAPANDLGLGRFEFNDAAGTVTRFYRVVYRP
jgi:hypothetical protein